MRQSSPALHKLCAAYHFDLVLIDGNEYTGWAEFNRVRTECRPTYLALHDTQTLKTQKIEEYLNTHHDEYQLYLRKYATQSMQPACQLVGCRAEGTFVPNSAGWSIYKRVETAADHAPPPAAADASIGGAPATDSPPADSAEGPLPAAQARATASVAAAHAVARRRAAISRFSTACDANLQSSSAVRAARRGT